MTYIERSKVLAVLPFALMLAGAFGEPAWAAPVSQAEAFAELDSVPLLTMAAPAPVVFRKDAQRGESAASAAGAYCRGMEEAFVTGVADYAFPGRRPTTKKEYEGIQNRNDHFTRAGAKYRVIDDGIADVYHAIRGYFYYLLLESGLDESLLKTEVKGYYQRGRAWAEANPEISAELRRELKGRGVTGYVKGYDDVLLYMRRHTPMPKDWPFGGSCEKLLPASFSVYVPPAQKVASREELFEQAKLMIPELRALEKLATDKVNGSKELSLNDCRRILETDRIGALETAIAKKDAGDPVKRAKNLGDDIRRFCRVS